MPAYSDQPSADPLPDLEPLYYLRNFDRLVHTATEQYHDLLLEAERRFVDTLFDTSELARALYVRLVSRRAAIFRNEKLGYEELGDLSVLAEELADAGLLEAVTTPTLEEVLGQCRKDELQDMFGDQLGLARSCSRADLESRIMEQLAGSDLYLKSWTDWYQGSLWRPLHAEKLELLQLLFFGNRRQNLTDFVLSDLGVQTYYEYPLDRNFRLFTHRSDIEDYLQVAQLRDHYYEAMEASDLEALLSLTNILLDYQPSVPTLQRFYKLINRLARQLEREALPELALNLYQMSAQHPARERSVRLLTALDDCSTALDLCKEIAADPWCEAELDFVALHQPRLHKRLSMPAMTRRKDVFRRQDLRLQATDQRVEREVADHYLQRWQQVHYVESALVNALFGLLFWDEMFAPVTGAFVNPFQSAPLDMYTPDFRRVRQAALDARLVELEEGRAAKRVLANFLQYQGLSNSWINWRYLRPEMLEQLLEHVPGQVLAAMLRRILFDPQSNRSGLPDLIAFDPVLGYLMVEVKGPGDQLQANQKRWVRFFEQHQIHYEVAWVSYESS